MALFRRPVRIKRQADGTFDVTLAPQLRDIVVQLLQQVGVLLDSDPDDPRLRRLQPPAYLDDDERQAAYELLAGEELRQKRSAAIALTVEVLERGTLTEDEMWSWMQALNAVRLVLGTQLDVSEDEELPALPPEHPDAVAQQAYHLLTFLQYEVIQALQE